MNRYPIPRHASRAVLSVLVFSGACTDGPVSPRVSPEPVIGHLTAEYECTAEFEAGTLHCDVLSVTGANGVRMDVMLFSAAAKGVNVGGAAYSGGDKSNPDTVTYNIALLNLIPQSIGTRDGATADTSRLVITTYQLTSPTPATVQLANADGTATFVDSTNGGTPLTYLNKQYRDYAEVIAPNDTSSAKLYRFVFSPSVTAMRFTYRIWTRVQYPNGWITVSPAPVLEPGGTTTLTGAAFNHLGTVLSDGITWSSSNTAVATVNSSTGQVTAVGQGTATITATSTVNTQRTGTRAVIVDAAPVVLSTTPQDGDTPVAADADIMIFFSEAVNVSASSFLLECPVGEGELEFDVSGTGTSTITLDPMVDLPELANCTVTVAGSALSDADANDGPDAMALDHVFSFEVGITIHP